jgi:tyrosine-protein kinase Etk/Wzc
MNKPNNEGRNWKETELDVDLKGIINKISNNWYWIISSVLICLLGAYFYGRYTPPMYKINARVYVNDQQNKGSGLGADAGALMDLGGLIGSQSSVENEVEILKTPDLMEDVVRKMKLNIVYSKRSKLVKREIYNPPFRIAFIKALDTIQSKIIEINKVSENLVSVKCESFEKEIHWNEFFRIEGIGVLQLVKDSTNTINGDDYFVTISSVNETVSRLMNQMSVDVLNKQVSIIDLSLEYPLQGKGEEILSTIINTYKQSNLQDKNAIADSTYTFIKQRLNVIASELGDVESDVESFKKRNKLADMTEQGRVLIQNSGHLTTELASAETQVLVLTELENYLKDEKRNKRVFPSSLVSADEVFTNLMAQYNNLLIERDKTLMSVTEATPFVQNLNSQISELRKGILANIQNAKSSYVATRDNLRSQVDKAQSQIAGVPQIEKNYLKLARNQQIKQELYIFLMQKAEEVSISKTSNISIAKVIAKPKATVYAVSPKKNIIYLVGLMLGFVFPLIIIFTKDFFNTTINTKNDILNLTQVPVLGEISHSLSADNLVVFNNARSAVAEQFRALRSNLSYYLSSKDTNIILLTSSMSGEGKSFTAINLANVLALIGKRVLLMELDLRKPGLSSKLKMANNLGISNYVINEELEASDIIKPLEISENMFLISSGPLPPNPGELLMNERVAALIEQLRLQFDYIIMDSPPIGVISDTEALFGYANMVLYLVRQKVTMKAQLSIVDDLYQSGKMKNIGIIVNDVMSKDYGYGYGYGNYDQEEKVSSLQSLKAKFK